MTEYAPRNSQDLNPFLANPHLIMSHYPGHDSPSYVYSNGQIPYTTVNTLYSTCTPNYLPSHSVPSTPRYSTEPSYMGTQYQTTSPGSISAATQYSTVPQHRYHTPRDPTGRRHAYGGRQGFGHEGYVVQETEDQDSFNDISMSSEPVVPSLEGYPDVKDFDKLILEYVQDLSPKKQDKALINAKRASNIRTVLIDKKTTTVESAQFRFWVKKMFTLEPNDPKVHERRKKICHEGKPVAIREKLFKILTMAHKQCQHGGRDKTSAQVRRTYSWVPKELISRFVKLCPTCQIRRGTARASTPESDSIKAETDYMDSQSPGLHSPTESRRSSVISPQHSASKKSSMHGATFGSAFQSQSRWATSAPETQSTLSMQSAPRNVLPQHTLSSNCISHNYDTTPHGFQSLNGHLTVSGASYMVNRGSGRHQQY